MFQNQQPVVYLHTASASLMTKSWTDVSFAAERPCARLSTLVVGMISVVRVTHPLAHVTAAQSISARSHAPALGRPVKVPRRPRLDLCLRRVVLAGQAQRVPGRASLLRRLDDPAPQLAVAAQMPEVADDVETHPGARQCNADAILILHEPDAGLPINPVDASNHRQQHNIVLFTLVVIDRAQPHILQQRPLPQKTPNQENLACIRSQNGDLRRRVSLQNEVVAERHHVRCLVVVRHTFQVFVAMLLAAVADKVDV